MFLYIFDIKIKSRNQTDFCFESEFFLFRFVRCVITKNPRHRSICTNDAMGVARPILNRDTGMILLITHETGRRTQIPPIMPCIITKVVLPQPLKYPIKQKRNDVKTQSMA